MNVLNPVKSFLGGLILTLVLVVLVPIVIDTFVQGHLEQLVGDRTFLMLSSDLIVSILVWIIILGFIVLMGAGGIFKRFGVVGILGLIVAYYLLGNLAGAVIPVLSLILVIIIGKVLRKRREEKRGGGDSRRVRYKVKGN